MRVLFLDQYSQWGGAQLVLRDVMTEARRRGWHAEFMAPGEGDLYRFCETLGIPAHSLPFGTYTSARKGLRDVLQYGPDIARASRSLRGIIAARRIDLVFVNGPRILPAVTGVPCPVVFHLHSLVDHAYSRFLIRRTLRRTRSRVICCCRFVADSLGGARQRSIVYNGVEDFRRQGTGRPLNRVPQIGIIGRIAPEKGHTDFLRAAEMVIASRPEVRFIVHGAALFSDPSFEQRLRAMPQSRLVEFRGWTGDVGAVLQELDILAVPSTGVESTPRIIMEALSAGTPVIAYPSGGIPELIRHGETGLLAAVSTPQALAGSIERLLADPVSMERLARNGRAEWETRFRLERFQREICDLLERSAEESGQPEAPSTIAGEDDLA